MNLLKKYMNAYLRLRGGSVGSMRASVEFVSKMTQRLIKEGGLPNLALASAVVSGWSFILRVQNYVAWFDAETGDLDRCVTLTDQDVTFYVDGKLVAFQGLGAIARPWKEGELRIQYVLGGGKNFHGSPYRRSIHSYGESFCPASTIADFVILRLELGVDFEADEPFHRTNNGASGYVRYNDIRQSLKLEAELQNLKGVRMTPHSLRSGGG